MTVFTTERHTALITSAGVEALLTALPLNNGQSFHTKIELTPENCPRHSSRKYNGIPQNIRKKKNGIKNAPVNQSTCSYTAVSSIIIHTTQTSARQKNNTINQRKTDLH